MPNYRVSFYKTLLTSDGHPSKCLQECIEVHDLEDQGGAAALAAKEFENRHGLRDWRVYADTIDVALMPAGAEERILPRPATGTVQRRRYRAS